MPSTQGLWSREISQTPIAVLDFETTGLRAGPDRVVEVSVIRIDPGQPPRVVLDTLINPGRRVAATHIHGITDADVADAPSFADIAKPLLQAISGCLLGAYNITFDLQFFEYELRRLGFPCAVPHICLMYLRPMLGLGRRCSLAEACRQHAIHYASAHQAYVDAMATAWLWPVYLETIQRRELKTFQDLAALKAYKFVASFQRAPLLAPPPLPGRRDRVFDKYKSRMVHG